MQKGPTFILAWKVPIRTMKAIGNQRIPLPSEWIGQSEEN
jgi:hypothetical protein